MIIPSKPIIALTLAGLLFGCSSRIVIQPPPPATPPATITSTPCDGAPLGSAENCQCYQQNPDGTRIEIPCPESPQ